MLNYFVVFICGFTTFFMQFVAAKNFLPNFGGSASVWISNLIFFQIWLSLSYFISLKFNNKKFLIGLFIIGILTFLNKTTVQFNQNDFFNIFINLIINDGFLFIALVMVSPYIQINQNKRFFNFYIFSNAGALICLVFYPFLDHLLGIFLQERIIIISSLLVFIFILFFNGKNEKPLPIEKINKNLLPIFYLSLISNCLLNSFSYFLIQDVANFPLLWSLPLLIFLLSYIWAFSKKPMFLHIVEKKKIIFIQATLVYLASGFKFYVAFLDVAIFVFLFFICMMVVQMELKNKFDENSNKTIHFYFITSLGGMVGAVFSLLLTLLFTSVNDYMILLFIFYVVLSKELINKPNKIIEILAILLVVLATSWNKNKTVVESARSFYGLVKVIEDKEGKFLYHGNIIHGGEKKGEKFNTYYQPKMIGDIFKNKKNIAVVGLGVGVVLNYLDTDVVVDVFEIDPNVVNLAKKHFSYIDNFSGKINFKIGDGRKELRKSEKKYDLIILDVFSGDSIPSHILTKQFFQEAKNKLNINGMLAVHISNNYLDLTKLLKNSSCLNGFEGSIKTYEENKIHAVWGKFSLTNTSCDEEVLCSDDHCSLLNFIKI